MTFCPALKKPATRLFAAALLAWAGTALAQPAGFTPNEKVASKRVDLIDVEFSQSRAMITWCDGSGQLWVGTVDRATGKLLDPTFQLVDGSAIKPADMAITTNGPEWISTATGDHIVYTKFVAGKPHKTSTARLAWAEGLADGTWALHSLGPDATRNAPYASEDAGDASPRISYVDAKNKHYWRNLYDDASEAPITGMPVTAKPVSARFTQGYRGIVYAKPVDGVNQVFQLKLDENKTVQITTDAGAKDERTVPWMWRAPDYGNKMVLMSTVNGNELRFYRFFDADGDGVSSWTAFHSVKLPAGATVASPEPFIYGNKSYVVLAIKTEPNAFPSAVWLANVDPAAPQFWKVSDDTALRSRIDPEVFISDQGPVIFYNRFNPALDTTGTNPNCKECSEGLWTASTGLGPL
ncbi:hypothetical protein [Ideonella sp.]|uniref:hypothetical protein n=1 Tax=Ideonella sp. TaxID=1929293 RepID=UPI003BB7410A